jgi:hypothetical protein
MAKAKKITKQELENVNKASKEYNNVVQVIGGLELRKQDLINQCAQLVANIEEIKKELNEKYGDVDIDLITGEYKKRAEDKKD